MKKIILSLMVLALAVKVSAQLFVSSTKNVGIGTTNPQQKLVVNGNIYFGSSSGNILGTTNSNSILFKVNGVLAGNTGNSGTDIVSFGYGSLVSNTTGYCNTAFGVRALESNTTGYNNIGNGFKALSSNTTGHSNIAIGFLSLESNTTGFNNTAIGYATLSFHTTGDTNTAVGSTALFLNTTGSANTAVGRSALSSNTTGNFNTAVGADANVNAGNLSLATAIGYGATATASNQVRIGNSSITSIGGIVGWTTFPSDKRAKKNIRPNVPGLAFINRLQPVTFNLDLDAIDGLLKIDRTKKRPGEEELSPELIEINKKAREAKEKVIQTGFIAQDVEVIAKSIGYDFSGVDVDETGVYGLRYAEFVVPLVKAVQELSEQVNELTELVHRLQKKETTLKNGAGGE